MSSNVQPAALCRVCKCVLKKWEDGGDVCADCATSAPLSMLRQPSEAFGLVERVTPAPEADDFVTRLLALEARVVGEGKVPGTSVHRSRTQDGPFWVINVGELNQPSVATAYGNTLEEALAAIEERLGVS